MIGRFSSRRGTLAPILTQDLVGARRYDRIAGYFTSSILEVAGEALDAMAEGAVARVVCNSSLDPLDVKAAQAAKQAMFREWCESLPPDVPPALKDRLGRLNHFLTSGRLQVRVLPDSTFGLIHGKAGVIQRPDGSRTCFMGSTNESKSGWVLNYELIWTDDSPEAVDWVQEEFEALWTSPNAFDLADAVIQDIERQTRRHVIPSVGEWKTSDAADPASPVVELPVYRRENGLWAHQKSFVQRAFTQHQLDGARFVLADTVGLGKTVQLALSAKLMALWGSGPVLVLVPKPLMEQWQDELRDLLDLPSAYWNGQQWVDEHGIAYPVKGIDELRRCPRRVGIVSTGLIVLGGEGARVLSSLKYECLILDEAHRARRRNLGPTKRDEKPEPNNLLKFVQGVATNTRSLLFATATPVQLDPIEAWDLLEALNRGHDGVLGNYFSRWRTQARDGLALVQGLELPPDDVHEAWEWMRNPLPPSEEDPDFKIIRDRLGVPAGQVSVPPEAYSALHLPEQKRVGDLREDFFGQHNPYIRHIVRRTREYLENTTDPQTNEPYLRRIRVRLFGEERREAIEFSYYLREAYEAAEKFCELVGARPGMNSGFLRTILLRRVGSTIFAGQQTVRKMLAEVSVDENEADDQEGQSGAQSTSALYPLRDVERTELERFLKLLEAAEEDPKGRQVERLLLNGTGNTGAWLEEGCIVFSQYYDSVIWLAGRLSALLPEETVGVYAGAMRSGLFRAGEFTKLSREAIKQMVKRDELRLVTGTDAASEGLNLQRLGTLINLDLPWNPTRLEQRKGRIQRIGQVRDEVLVFNMRYRDSVEDRVHELLSERLESISNLFGQLPDTLEDVWVQVAERNEAKAREIIDEVPKVHPFRLRNDRIDIVDWESCAQVLDRDAQSEVLEKGWS